MKTWHELRHGHKYVPDTHLTAHNGKALCAVCMEPVVTDLRHVVDQLRRRK